MRAEGYEDMALIIHLYNNYWRSKILANYIMNMFTWELVDYKTDTSRFWYPKWESGASKCGGGVN